MSVVSAERPPLFVTRAAHAVVLAFGWKRASIAFVAGAASALSMAPVNAWPVLFVTFPVLVWLIDGSTQGRRSAVWSAAIAGWCFGFGYFLFGLYWVGYAFLVDAKTCRARKSPTIRSRSPAFPPISPSTPRSARPRRGSSGCAGRCG